MVNKHWPPMTKEDRKLWRMVKQLSPEDFVRWQKGIARIFVNVLSETKTPEELIEARDKMLVSFPRAPIIAAEMKKKFHEALLEKRRIAVQSNQRRATAEENKANAHG